MLIPSIDLRGGKVVQLVQGRRLAIESADVFGWVERFARFPRVQLIDLDAAIGTGSNAGLVAEICKRLRCRVGGGLRSIDAAQAALAHGADAVIIGSALFRDGAPDLDFAGRLADAVGVERIIGAVDAHRGEVVIHGWQTALPLSPADAVRRLDALCGEFLYTHVDTEGLLGGIDMDAVLEVRRATGRRLSAAGGIRSRQEIDLLDAQGIDAVVGMAIYTGVLDEP